MEKVERPNPPFFGRFRTKLVVLVLVPVVPALALALQRNFEQRRTEQARVVHEINAVSRQIAANELGYIRNARQILATLSGLSLLADSTNQEFCSVNLNNLCKLLPDYLNFGMIEPDGTVFASAVPVQGTAPSLADRPYFKRVMATRGFVIGDYQVGRLSRAPSINFAFPVLGSTGEVRRVFFGSLQLERLTETARQVELPPGAVATVIDSAGAILARLPNDEGWIGRTVPDMVLVRDVLKMKQGILKSTGLDGVRRIYTITPISDDDSRRIFVTVGVPTEVLFANANQALKRNLLVMFVTVVAALLISSVFAERVFARPVSALSETADRLAHGELDARAEVFESTAELRQLSQAFNSMAARLQERDAEINRAREEIERMNAELEKKVRERTAQLSAANQELESFSYSVSHDLRAPLRHLDGFAELLKRNQRDKLDEKGRRHLDIISQAARRMGTLIDELLVFSRMGRQELLSGAVDMGRLVRETIEQLEPDYAGRKIEWTVPALPCVEADAAMIRQVWLNLISNAIKYTRPREVARIEMGTSDMPTEHVFYVRDNGVGFDMKYADKLFGVFQRLHAENEFEGTGIGLANVRRVILRHGGRTWAESSPGEGSTFYFSLPKNDQTK